MPTAQPFSGVAKLTPKSVFSVPTGRFSQVRPPSALASSVPNSPAMKPCCGSGKDTA